MALEIERKFLIASESWRARITRSMRIIDGLVLAEGGRKLRVRVTDGLATLTFKGKRRGIAREEIELPLDADHARVLLDHHCAGRILGKMRHLVRHGELTWEIDEYDPPLNGVILAEVELPSADHPVVLPDWAGREVTGEPAWRKEALLEALANSR